MARTLRVQYPGAIYHVMNRGDRREAIFLSDKDRALFVQTLDEPCQKTDWQLHAWCLMSNHFHIVLLYTHAAVRALRLGALWLRQWKSEISNPCVVSRLVFDLLLFPISPPGTFPLFNFP